MMPKQMPKAYIRATNFYFGPVSERQLKAFNWKSIHRWKPSIERENSWYVLILCGKGTESRGNPSLCCIAE